MGSFGVLEILYEIPMALALLETLRAERLIHAQWVACGLTAPEGLKSRYKSKTVVGQ